MSTYMSPLIVVLLELNLYIFLASSLSVTSQSHVRQDYYTKPNEDLHKRPGVFPLVSDGQVTLPGGMPIPPRDNKMDDLFFEKNSIGEISNDENGSEEPRQKLPAYNTISLDNSIDVEPEMLTNNHHLSKPHETQATTTSANLSASNLPGPGQNSRHYSGNLGQGGTLQTSYPYHPSSHYHHQYHQSQQYGKYSPNMFANNYNLNYIHGLLANKPSPSSVTSGLSVPSSYSSHANNPHANPMSAANQYSLSSSHQQQQANGFVSSYISASSALSAAVSNLQQTIAQKQQHLSSINSQLQMMSGSTSMSSSYASSGQDSQVAVPGSGSSPSSSSFGAKCGRQQVAYREPRVVGGNNTYEGEFPWAVSIQRHGNHHCGGVIVDRRWILTAAHCVRSQMVGNLAVRTGGHTLSRSLNGISSHLERDYQVEQIVMHDDFSRYDNQTALQAKSAASTNNADIALLKLKQDIHWNDLAWPVCFPERDAGNFSGHDAIVIGWGKLNEKSEEFSNELQKVKLTIIDNKVCQNWFRQAGRDMPIDDRIICAGFKHGGKDACHGDSGGPLLSRINGQYVVVGVVSTGIGCARPLLPGLYSRVSSYINWIERYVTN